MNRAVARLLERPTVYLAWQRPFASAKLAPVKRHNDFRRARRVLDVGCGPGTNAAEFAHADYLGIDVNHAYFLLLPWHFEPLERRLI
ncbi:MAG TPA: class I SAM-dependent methyltransferase [Gaiellaceae bacterium]|nr:class I SAM-dependent methyltransferase [Gaiellaceae bacterium]